MTLRFLLSRLFPTRTIGKLLPRYGLLHDASWQVLVSSAGGNVEHDDGAVCLFAAAVVEARAEFVFTKADPNIESNGTSVCLEVNGMDIGD